MTVRQIVRNILERASEDGLICPATEEMREEADPQQFGAEDLAGCTNLLAAFLRRQGRRWRRSKTCAPTR